MALDPELQVVVDLANAVDQPVPTEATVDEMRAAFAGLVAIFGAGSSEVSVEDRELAGPLGPVPVRFYRAGSSSEAPSAALVWFHGGGWVIGDIDTHDALCRDLAVASGSTVVSVGYRLAPEHRFPAAHDDCSAVVEHLLTDGAQHGLDPTRLVLGGDSAGGHLATVTARRLRDRSRAGGATLPPLRGQVLVYPVTDLAGSSGEHPSRDENGTGYLLTARTMDFFTDMYVPDRADRAHLDASPLRAPDLTELPPALVVVAGYDPLRDEGLAYAEALSVAGVATTLEHLEGGIHLCAQMPSTAIGRELVERVGDYVSRTIRARP